MKRFVKYGLMGIVTIGLSFAFGFIRIGRASSLPPPLVPIGLITDIWKLLLAILSFFGLAYVLPRFLRDWGFMEDTDARNEKIARLVGIAVREELKKQRETESK